MSTRNEEYFSNIFTDHETQNIKRLLALISSEFENAACEQT